VSVEPVPLGELLGSHLDRDRLLARVLASPFTDGGPDLQQRRRRGLIGLVNWLASQPGATWQQRWTSTWRLSRLLLSGGLRHIRFGLVADRMAWGNSLVPDAGCASRSGLAGFRCTGWLRGLRAEAAKSTPDPGGRHPA
jgi:hypothetical protein